LSSGWDPEQRERRATDGLAWHAPRSEDEESTKPNEGPAPVPQRLEGPGGGARRTVGLALAAGAIGGLIAGLIVGFAFNSNDVLPNGRDGDSLSLTVEQTSAVIDAAAQARPSVVRIESTRRTATGVVQDVGSGVILDSAGHILTNAHVVLGTDTLTVFLADGTERKAILLGHDYPFTDLAVLQIGPGNLMPVKIGNSDGLTLGETVLAIGNPLSDFEGSVSVGVVSGMNRKRTFDAVVQGDLIQTDAAVNQGNSGGALVNLRAEFIGMPTSVVRESRTGQPVEGIAFALPSSRIMTIATRIIREGNSYPRPTLGLDHLDITPEVLARAPRLAIDEGAVVTQVLPGGPADSAGIRAGDVITAIGTEPVNRASLLLNALMRFEPGETVRVVLNRDGRIIEVEVRLGKRA
jgi:S1-C subfamily serine protease